MKDSSLSIRFEEMSHSWPPCIKVFRISLLFITYFRALDFPLLAKALVVSHPVYACIPISALQTSMPTVATTFLMSINLLLVLVPHFWNNGAHILSWKAKHMINTSVSSAHISIFW